MHDYRPLNFLWSNTKPALRAGVSVLAFFMMLGVGSAHAVTISDIRVDGAARLEKETVLSYLGLTKGEDATPERLDTALKALYSTGLFNDLHLDMGGSTLVVQVEENPIVNRVIFEGYSAISKEDMEKEIQIKSRLVYTLPKVQKDVQRILDLYRRSGRFGAVVEPKIVKLEQNRVDVIFEITEGDRTGISTINFVGNNQFGASQLRSVVSTRESAWWRFFSSSDYYDPDRMNYDKELLRKFYLNEGYVDFRVVSAVAELKPDHSDFYMTFALDEGERYKVGKITLTSDIKGLDAEILRAELLMQSGDWYNAEKVEKTVTKLTTLLGDRQYAFATVMPATDRRKDTQTVDLSFDIKQGERVYVGRIDINGNARTIDKVIRREIPLVEGDPFSTTSVHKAEQNLKDLGYFDDVKVMPTEGVQPDRANLKVDVKEKSTGEIAVGAGYSSSDGPLGNFSLSERNFMGKGQSVRLGGTISGRTRQVDTSFTEPHFLDRDLSAGVDLYRTESDYQDLSSYNSRSTGINLRTGYPLSEDLRQGITYSFHTDTISSVPSDASLYVKDQQGTAVTSSIGQSLTYDTRDSKLTPTLGYILKVNTDVAGLGGTRDYFKVRMGATQYYPVMDDYVLSGLVETGQIWGIGGPTKINERFFLGGDTLRGFEFAGIGPRDVSGSSDDALGGTRFSRASVELDMPTPFPEELGLRSHLFTDAGMLGNVDADKVAGYEFKDPESLHLSAGIGVSWASPFGPIRINLAKALMKNSYDKTQFLHFSFGTRF